VKAIETIFSKRHKGAKNSLKLYNNRYNEITLLYFCTYNFFL
jgi:hypothetical protein